MTIATLSTNQIPANVLQSLIEKQATGKLIVRNPLDEFVTWQVYLGKGKIHFANSGVGCIERIKYLLGNYLTKQKIDLPQQINDDYKYLCDLWKKEVFSFQQTRSVLTQFTQEALVQVLSLPKTECSFDYDKGLKHLFLNLDLDKTISPVEHKIKYWGELHPLINSPFQRPLVENWQEAKAMLNSSHQRSAQWCEHFLGELKNLSCLYEIARKTNTSVLELALLLRPQIKQGKIKMLSYQEIESDNRPVVISVNHHQSIQKIIQDYLGQKEFKVVCIKDSCQALAAAISHNPHLILIDAEMPEISGYELCRLLRKSSAVRETPIILLNQQDGVMEQIQGHLAKATGQINKQFLLDELLQVNRNYLSPVMALSA